MEGLVQQLLDYIMSPSQLSELANHSSLVPAVKHSHNKVPIMFGMSQIPMNWAAESVHQEGFLPLKVQSSEVTQG